MFMILASPIIMQSISIYPSPFAYDKHYILLGCYHKLNQEIQINKICGFNAPEFQQRWYLNSKGVTHPHDINSCLSKLANLTNLMVKKLTVHGHLFPCVPCILRISQIEVHGEDTDYIMMKQIC